MNFLQSGMIHRNDLSPNSDFSKKVLSPYYTFTRASTATQDSVLSQTARDNATSKGWTITVPGGVAS